MTPIFMRIWFDENDTGHGFVDGGRELSQGLGHEPCLQAHVLIAHLPFQFALGTSAATESMMRASMPRFARGSRRCRGPAPGVGLGHEEAVHIHSSLRHSQCQRVLGIDVSDDTPGAWASAPM